MLAARRSLFWLLLLLSCISVLLTSLGVAQWVHFPALSLNDVSRFLNHYDKGIACLRQHQCVISFSEFFSKGTFWSHINVPSPRVSGIDDSVAYPARFLYLETLCFLFSSCVLVIAHAALCYIIWLRYIKLLQDGISLLWKALRQMDCHTPLYALSSLFAWTHFVLTKGMHLWYQLSPRNRYIFICLAVFIVCTVSIRFGLGRRRFWALLPLAITWLLYYNFQIHLSPRVQYYLVHYGGSHSLYLWTFWMLRHYRVEWHPSLRLVDKSRDSPPVICEMNCLLDLFLISCLSRICGNLPILGALFVRQNYSTHVMFFVSVMMILHCAFAKWLQDDVLQSPLSSVKTIIIVTIDTIVNYAVGWPNIISSRIYSSNRPSGVSDIIYRRIGAMLSLMIPSTAERFSHITCLSATLRWIKLAPRLVVLLLPRVILSLYFTYLTLVSPVIHCVLLPRKCPFKSQMVVALHFICADVVRSMVLFTKGSYLPLRSLACILLPIFIDSLRHHMEYVNLDQEHKRSN